jgi:hypothetical protein
MCFTRRTHKQRKQKRRKNAKIHPEQKYDMEEIFTCNGCQEKYKLDDMKIICAGCSKLFHCKVAGTCYGKNCKAEITDNGEMHRLSWCMDCVPKLLVNNEKTDRTERCICKECYIN